MEKIAKLRLVVDPSAKKVNALTDAIARLSKVIEEINAKGALSLDVKVSTKTEKVA